MFRNYIKIAFRNLWKNRLFTILNIVGLTIAFCVATLLTIASLDRLGQDQFHENKSNLYQVYASVQTTKGAEATISNATPFAPALINEVPGIKNITRYSEENLVVFNEDKALQLDAGYVDDSFLDLFTFPIIKGNKVSPLSEKSSVVLTQKSALKIFGTEDVVGKTIMVQKGNSKEPYLVSAIAKDYPKESSITFGMLFNFENNPYFQHTIDSWGDQYHNVYLELDEGVTTHQFEERSRAFVTKHYQENIDDAIRDGVTPNKKGQYFQLRLFPFVDNSFTTFKDGLAKISRTMPYMILGISMLILFIASVNFINMNIAKSGQRLREIGMRKTLGASKLQLFGQLWTESVFVFTLSLTLGLLLAYGLLNDFQTLFRTSGTFSILIRTEILLTLIAVVLCISLIAGGYPALLMSKLGTLKALKGKLEVNSGNRLRNTLIVSQFCIACLLISCTLVLNKQIHFLRHKDLGFDKYNIVSIPLNGKLNSRLVINRLRNELQNEPEILSVSAADNNLGLGKDGSGYASISGFDYKDRVVKTHNLIVDYDYIKTMGLELIEGRTFDRSFSTDSLSMVINESMAKEYGEKNPLDVSVDIYEDGRQFKVIGVIKDYNFQNLKKEIKPLTFFMEKEIDFYYAFIKVDPENAIVAYDKIESAWKKIEPDATFLGSFLDENIDRTLRREKILTTIITCGSIVAIVLSCIGLFAISMIVVNQRTKEIGVRKIVGASITSLVKLLLKDFLWLVIIAFVIATPVAWWLSSQWLQDYSYKIVLSLDLFFAAGLVTLFIAMLTVGFKTLKAANANPVNSLRSE